MLKRGKMVAIRTWPEIQTTLDENGTVEGLPFMPEMLKYCGQQFQVRKRIHFACVEQHGYRRFHNIVSLDSLRCSGEYHDGCKRACDLFWKETWLSEDKPSLNFRDSILEPSHDFPFSVRDAWGEKYYCQSTQLQQSSSTLRSVDKPALLYKEFISRNQNFHELTCNVVRFVFAKAVERLSGRTLRRKKGTLQRTPTFSLALKAGERVRIKEMRDIIQTLDRHGRNQGLDFSPEMYQYCGREALVKDQLDRIIVESSGEMRILKNTVLLENITCEGRCNLGCPRENYHFWREIWLEKI